MRRRLQLETKNYAKNSGKWDFSTISATIFSLKKEVELLFEYIGEPYN